MPIKCPEDRKAYDKLKYARAKADPSYKAKKSQKYQENKDKWKKPTKEEKEAYNKNYYSKNSEKEKTRTKIDYHANREARRQTNVKWMEDNKDRRKNYVKAYRATPSAKAKRAAAQRKRDAAKLKATPSWLTSEHLGQIESFYQEAARLTSSTGVPHEVDHIVPLQGATVRGLHVPWNLQILTKSENASKNNRY